MSRLGVTLLVVIIRYRRIVWWIVRRIIPFEMVVSLQRIRANNAEQDGNLRAIRFRVRFDCEHIQLEPLMPSPPAFSDITLKAQLFRGLKTSFHHQLIFAKSRILTPRYSQRLDTPMCYNANPDLYSDWMIITNIRLWCAMHVKLNS